MVGPEGPHGPVFEVTKLFECRHASSHTAPRTSVNLRPVPDDARDRVRAAGHEVCRFGAAAESRFCTPSPSLTGSVIRMAQRLHKRDMFGEHHWKSDQRDYS